MIRYVLFLVPFLSFGQSFAPEPGVVGSTAMHRDSSSFIFWASDAVITRGPLDIQNVSLGDASYGVNEDVGGFPDGVGVVSLGDAGEALVTFPAVISNGPGPDFAVFENGFIDHYMEFAFVEVSSDGIQFFRFDAISEIPTDTQLTNFSTSDCRYVNNLAGKYRANYGTPFDLDELQGTPGLDVNSITHIKLIDVVGSIDPAYGSYDSQGSIINDPYPTPFESCGFDLDAIGVIHSTSAGVEEKLLSMNCYPNPVVDVLHLPEEIDSGQLCNANGLVVQVIEGKTIDVSSLCSGVYFVHFSVNGQWFNQKVTKL